jgi:hypothetical protein
LHDSHLLKMERLLERSLLVDRRTNGEARGGRGN